MLGPATRDKENCLGAKHPGSSSNSRRGQNKTFIVSGSGRQSEIKFPVPSWLIQLPTCNNKGALVVSVWFSFSDDPSQEQEEGRRDPLMLMEPSAVFASVHLKSCPVEVLRPRSTVCAQ